MSRIKKIRYWILDIAIVFLFSCFFAFNVNATDYIQPEIKVYSDYGDKIEADFLAFDKKFKGGAYPAIGEVDNDGKDEIVVGAGYGGGPQVRIFKIINKSSMKVASLLNFYAFSQNYKGGVNVAVCNLDNKGKNEIVVGKALEDKSEVAVYKISKKGKINKITSFLAYEESFKGGVNIACGDLNNDEKDEIITGPGPTGRGHVKIFKYVVKKKEVTDLGVSFFAFDQNFKGGATVAVINNKIIVGQATKGNQIYIYKTKIGKKNKLKADFVRKFTVFENFSGGINVAAGYLDFGKPKILVSPASNGGPVVNIFELKGKLLTSFVAYADDFRGGVRIGITHESNANTTNNGTNAKEQEFIFVTTPGFKKGNKCIRNCVALTFDDGYSSASGSFDHILDVLKDKKAHATFFMLGIVMKGYPDRMLRIDREGHQLANHSYSHASFTLMSSSQIINEITYSDQIAKSITGKPTKPYFRYPGGSHNASTDFIVKNLGYKYFGWTASAGDSSSNVTVQSATWGMLWNLHDGSIILAHTMKDQTAAALPTVIDAIRRAGYTLATLDEMSEYWNIGN